MFSRAIRLHAEIRDGLRTRQFIGAVNEFRVLPDMAMDLADDKLAKRRPKT